MHQNDQICKQRLEEELRQHTTEISILWRVLGAVIGQNPFKLQHRAPYNRSASLRDLQKRGLCRLRR